MSGVSNLLHYNWHTYKWSERVRGTSQVIVELVLTLICLIDGLFVEWRFMCDEGVQAGALALSRTVHCVGLPLIRNVSDA